MAQCFYTLYYLLLGTLNMKPDIVTLLKSTKLSFLCVMNPDRLKEIEDNFKVSGAKFISRKKNSRTTGNCSDSKMGVNLKYNFRPDNASNGCTDLFRGIDSNYEPEIKCLLDYISLLNSPPTAIVILGK